jgi:hypothetical protein
MTMKNYFTITAVLVLTATIALFVAGAISKSNSSARSAYETKLKSEVDAMAKTMDDAATQIEQLSTENTELKARLLAATDTTKKPATKTTKTVTTPTKPVSKPVATKPAEPTGTTLTASLAAGHSSESDCWIIVSGKVYAVSPYISMHPGGRSTIVNQCGKDATQAFSTRGGTGKHSSSAHTMLGTYLLGAIGATVKL